MYYLAQHINAASGGTVIAPWQVPELPLEWIEGAQAITSRIEPAKKANQVIDGKMAAWRNSHPAYHIKH
jgi:hypothetical protein